MERVAAALPPDVLADVELLAEIEQEKWKQKVRELKWSGDPLASFYASNCELVYCNTASGTAKTTFTTEATPILNDEAGMGQQAKFPAGFFLPGRIGIAGKIVVRGIFSVAAATTPTYQWLVRLGATGTGGSLVWESPAATTASGVTTKGWQFEADLVLRTNAAVGANSTVQGIGPLICDSSGVAAASQILMGWANNTQPGTVATLNTAIDNLVNVNVICSASSASNSVTLLQLLVYGLN